MNQSYQVAVIAESDDLQNRLVELAAGDTLAIKIAGADVASAAQAVVILDDGDPEVTANVLENCPGKVILISSKNDLDNINDILAKYPVHHIIGRNGPSVPEEAYITLRKLLTNDIWGLDKYLADEAKIVTHTIKHAREINDAIESLLNQVDLKQYFAATYEALRLAANEFVTNAVYNAPIDKDNNPKYEHVNRKNKVALLEDEFVDLTVGWDTNKVGICVSDRFGRLSQDKIVKHFVKCANNIKFIENKKGGAGAGVYLAFYMSNQYVLNVEPGKKMECICILERNRSYKSYRTRVTSFNFFKKIGGAA